MSSAPQFINGKATDGSAIGPFLPVRPLTLEETVTTAGLVRVSSERQVREEGDFGSIAKQSESIKLHAERQNWKLVEIFEDEAEQGDTADRKGLKRMLAAARDGKFRRLLVTRQSRLGRGIVVIKEVVGELERLGIHVYETSGRQITLRGKGAKLTLVQAMLDELELLTIRERASDDRVQTAAVGRWRSGPAPDGYLLVKEPGQRSGLLKLDSARAPIIKWLFDQVRARRKIGAIIADAKQKGYKTKEGKEINQGYITRVIHNVVYMAKIAISDFRKLDTTIPPQWETATGIALFEAIHPLIVTDQEWVEAQIALDGRPRSKRAPRTTDTKGRTLIQGIFSCECCSGTLSPHVSLSTVAYAAKRDISKPKCRVHRVPAQIADDVVLRVFGQFVESPARIIEVLSLANKEAQSPRKRQELQELQRSRDALATELENVRATARECCTSEGRKHLAEDIDRISASLSAVTQQLATAADAQFTDVPIDLGKMRQALENLASCVDQLDRSRIKQALRGCVESVTVGERKADVPGSRRLEFSIVLHDGLFSSKEHVEPLRATIEFRENDYWRYQIVAPFELRVDLNPDRPAPAAADLSPHGPLPIPDGNIEKLQFYLDIMKARGLKHQKQLAEAIAMSNGHVSQIMALATIDERLRQTMARSEKLFSTKARNEKLFPIKTLRHIAKLPPNAAELEVNYILRDKRVA